MERPDSFFDKPNNHFEIAELVTKFLEGQLSEEESERLNVWIAENEEHQRMWQRMIDPVYLEKHLQYWDNKDPDVHWQALRSNLDKRRPVWKIVSRKALKYAAILLPVLFLLGIGWYLLEHKEKNRGTEQTIALAETQILPKGKVAKLVLGNGKIVQLTDSLKEDITEKDGTKVSNQGSTLYYLTGNKDKKNKVLFNTLMTPRGGEYQLVLADGTKVWLNAASSLRYPTQFDGKERKVYLTGEAYFEVSPSVASLSAGGGGIAKPFIVNTGKMDVTVLGTRFNVSAYADDAKQTTTLAEGSVRITNNIENNRSIVLKPGYEAVLIGNNNEIQVDKANIKAALAWKNGLFIFNSETLGHVMRILARWYDVEVKYEKDVDTLLHFTGRIRKYESITDILEKIEMTGKIEFSIQGREVRVISYRERQKH